MPDLPDNDARDGLIAAAEDLADVQAAREAREEIAAGTAPHPVGGRQGHPRSDLN